MAVEPPHVNLFHPHSLTTTNNIGIDIDDGVMTLPATMPYSTYHHHHHHIHVLPRKRSRLDSITESNVIPFSQKNKFSSQTQPPSFFDNQQSEIDRFIAIHTEKVRMELEEQSNRQSRKLLSVIQYTIEKKLMEKDEEIDRITKLNWMLQERVKSICAENQIWRELAHTNEVTAISLRTNLDQVLAAQISEDHRDDNDDNDDAESSSGSNCGGGGGGDVVVVGRMCKNCGVRESIVLLLPCRHLCLCTMCGSTTRNCPLCYSGINASVHVNFD
ncbi:hypothetical protein TanjilG_23089 [Lupinus angustifolius]|uniref:RING-type domain-containing protein n=1 Tax=Lupinus angustifolius TaxID=3871 RepID=A0A1J7FYV3_LUPAN|nr:PREDICTED: E3 ubiquitin-protein ligase BOI-like [Lupinus angustifolius]OIV93317.1 hypothetical protein TanjilG_23089 [Lupinus angustifolius]